MSRGVGQKLVGISTGLGYHLSDLSLSSSFIFVLHPLKTTKVFFFFLFFSFLFMKRISERSLILHHIWLLIVVPLCIHACNNHLNGFVNIETLKINWKVCFDNLLQETIFCSFKLVRSFIVGQNWKFVQLTSIATLVNDKGEPKTFAND